MDERKTKTLKAVSYTHLDVYKRQVYHIIINILQNKNKIDVKLMNFIMT